MSQPSLSRQLAAVEAQTAILEGRSTRPKPAQMAMLMPHAKAAADTFRMIVCRPDFTAWLHNQKDKTP